MNDTMIQHLCHNVAGLFVPHVQEQPFPALMIASFVVCNLAMFIFTRGKEFVIGGVSGILFLVPFLKIMM